MFEYAFFLSCKERGMRIKLNRDLYEINRMHDGYLLDHVFGVPKSDLAISCKLSVLATRILRRFQPLGLVYKEKALTFCNDIYTTKKVFFDGCFIEPRYFEGIEDQIRQSFVFRGIDSHNINLGSQMLSENSVSLHVRRGDYLTNPIYCVCDEMYYKLAIKYIKSRVSNPLFYVFSDDTEWCNHFMESLDVNYSIITQNKGENSYKDMYLMSHCRHNIIANSTFSWWGAWLNDNKEKIVISPNKWTNNIRMKDVPLNWLLLEV